MASLSEQLPAAAAAVAAAVGAEHEDDDAEDDNAFRAAMRRRARRTLRASAPTRIDDTTVRNAFSPNILLGALLQGVS